MLKSLAPSHRGKIKYVEYYQSVCSCGWTGPICYETSGILRSSRGDAEADLAQHRRMGGVNVPKVVGYE